MESSTLCTGLVASNLMSVCQRLFPAEGFYPLPLWPMQACEQYNFNPVHLRST